MPKKLNKDQTRKKHFKKTTTNFIKAIVTELYQTQTSGDIARRFNVSREYIRQIGNRLRDEGFKIPIPGKGCQAGFHRLYRQRSNNIARAVWKLKKLKSVAETYLDREVCTRIYFTKPQDPNFTIKPKKGREVIVTLNKDETLILIEFLKERFGLNVENSF